MHLFTSLKTIALEPLKRRMWFWVFSPLVARPDAPRPLRRATPLPTRTCRPRRSARDPGAAPFGRSARLRARQTSRVAARVDELFFFYWNADLVNVCV